MELVIAIVILVAGCGGTGIGLAWLNDRRHAAKRRGLPERDPKTVLAARLAKGDIDEAEYNRKMHLLMYGPPLELDRPE